LLHDIGKPGSFSVDEMGVGHFLGHAALGAELADEILHRLKASNALREEVLFLIKHHMDRWPCEEKAARRCLSRYGLQKMERLTQLQMADFGGDAGEAELEDWLALLRTISQREGELTLKTLAVSGRDLMALGMAPGPKLGQTLNGLLARVLAGELPNERQALLDSVFGKEM
jgi:tRNA nucleotidyltransferase (CCA-adding enzyme)